MPADIVVVGSINFDIFLFAERLPNPGETLAATGVSESFGGKGANQAVQAAKLGQRVAFVGAVGADARGEACVANVQKAGVDCHIATVPAATGLGVVHVLPGGMVFATIVDGANAQVSAEIVRCHASLFEGAACLLLQNEIPEDGVRAAIEVARKHGLYIIYNAAPSREGSAALAAECDCLIVNEEEASALLGVRVASLDELSKEATMLARYCQNVIVTMGEHGCLVWTNGGPVVHVPAVPADAIDTTGAGDSFVGAFASALCRGSDEIAAATVAVGVAAQTTTGVGAQTSMPTTFGGSNDSLQAARTHP